MVAEFESVVKIQLRLFLDALGPISAQNLALTREQLAVYGLSDRTIVFLIEFY